MPASKQTGLELAHRWRYCLKSFHRLTFPAYVASIGIVAFPMASELFMRIKESGTRIALATSSGKADLAVYKKIARIEYLVEKASSSDDAESSKPDPDIFAAALSMVQMRSDQAIALGDTPYDAEAAGKLGIPVIGLTCGGWKRDDLKDAGCIEVYMNPEALLREFGHSVPTR